MPDLYQLTNAAVRVLDSNFTAVADFPASNSFERTVPEPSAALLAAGALATQIVLVGTRRRSKQQR